MSPGCWQSVTCKTSSPREIETEFIVCFFSLVVLEVFIPAVGCEIWSPRCSIITHTNMQYYHPVFTLHTSYTTTMMTIALNPLILVNSSSTTGCSCLFCLRSYPSKRRLSCWSVTSSVFRWVSGWLALSDTTGRQIGCQLCLVQLFVSRYMHLLLIISMEFSERGNQWISVISMHTVLRRIKKTTTDRTATNEGTSQGVPLRFQWSLACNYCSVPWWKL